MFWLVLCTLFTSGHLSIYPGAPEQTDLIAVAHTWGEFNVHYSLIGPIND
jgi:hypothetical protein